MRTSKFSQKMGRSNTYPYDLTDAFVDNENTDNLINCLKLDGDVAGMVHELYGYKQPEVYN